MDFVVLLFLDTSEYGKCLETEKQQNPLLWIKKRHKKCHWRGAPNDLLDVKIRSTCKLPLVPLYLLPLPEQYVLLKMIRMNVNVSAFTWDSFPFCASRNLSWLGYFLDHNWQNTNLAESSKKAGC